tara:strand:+ start:120 stop:2495 length:2376 start_codon:yes stop_codon:yes gene_type:complete
MNYPVLPLRDIVIFPHMIVPLFVGREKSVQALEEAMSKKKEIVLLSQKDPRTEDPKKKDLFDVGTIGSILQLLKLPDGTVKVLVEGKKRVKISEISFKDLFLKADVKTVPESPDSNIDKTKINVLHTVFEDFINLNKKANNELINVISEIKDPGHLSDTIASNLNLDISEKQKFLENFNVSKRIDDLIIKLETEIGSLQAENKVRSRVKRQMEKIQREYYLNEQLKAIQKELGTSEDGKNEFQELDEKIKKIKFSKEANEKVNNELKKLKSMSPMSAEATVVRTYIDWIISIPWNKESKIKNNLNEARKILEADHYGLKKVKDRIIEFLAVQKRTNSVKGPILCLVGPPGVGKTSLGQSIAKASGRKYIRMALGGVRDEAEIRGHRKTYIGSLPGKIIQGMKKSKFVNPLFLLDEIDKLGSDYRGDPSSGLLEVLDPEQNKTFQDHYIEVDYDLSKVLFVTTANTLNIPPALLDRMEVIRISGYTEDEKLEIAKRHLLTKHLKECNLSKKEFQITDKAIAYLIQKYTREAGVRSLEREISKLIRKVVTDIELNGLKSIKIDHKNLNKFLGVEKFSRLEIEKNDIVGVSTGLAWTEVGGELLSIESVKVPGKGKVTATGKLGDVMKESIQAAEFFIKSRANDLGIDNSILDKLDIHVHVPEGATPKDGPSAGVAMVTSIVSALTQIKVKKDLGMTGEITLRGRVLPIGGLKEKLLAAKRSGLKQVLIPVDNKKDLAEIPDDIKDNVEIITVSFVEDVINHALVTKPKPIKEIKNAIPSQIDPKPVSDVGTAH